MRAPSTCAFSYALLEAWGRVALAAWLRGRHSKEMYHTCKTGSGWGAASERAVRTDRWLLLGGCWTTLASVRGVRLPGYTGGLGRKHCGLAARALPFWLAAPRWRALYVDGSQLCRGPSYSLVPGSTAEADSARAALLQRTWLRCLLLAWRKPQTSSEGRAGRLVFFAKQVASQPARACSQP